MTLDQHDLQVGISAAVDDLPVASLDLAAVHYAAGRRVRRRRVVSVAATLVVVAAMTAAVIGIVGGGSSGDSGISPLARVPLDSTPLRGLHVTDTFELPKNPPQTPVAISGTGNELWLGTSPIGPYPNVGRVWHQVNGVLQPVLTAPESQPSVSVLGDRAFVVTTGSVTGMGDDNQATAVPILREYDATTGQLISQQSLASPTSRPTAAEVDSVEDANGVTQAILLQVDGARHQQIRGVVLSADESPGSIASAVESPFGFVPLPPSMSIAIDDRPYGLIPNLDFTMVLVGASAPIPYAFEADGGSTGIRGIDLRTGAVKTVPGTTYSPTPGCRALIGKRHHPLVPRCASPQSNIYGDIDGRLLYVTLPETGRELVGSVDDATLAHQQTIMRPRDIGDGFVVGGGGTGRFYTESRCSAGTSQSRDQECLRRREPATLRPIGALREVRAGGDGVTSYPGLTANYGFDPLPLHSPSGPAAQKLDVLAPGKS